MLINAAVKFAFKISRNNYVVAVLVCKTAKYIMKSHTGGGGIRTPVPRCFKTGVYMLSRFIVFRLIKRQTTGS
jgi:hypothetical protein